MERINCRVCGVELTDFEMEMYYVDEESGYCEECHKEVVYEDMIDGFVELEKEGL